MKPRPDRKVIEWIEGIEPNAVHLSVVTILELRRGVELLEPSHRKKQLDLWISKDLIAMFRDRILSIDLRVAERCGQLSAESKRKGWNLEAIDALIAATALAYGLALATLNRRHFERLGLELVKF